MININKNIKSPLNYIGGKHKLLNQLLPLFPNNIDNFVDLFSGGCNVAVNINSNKVYCNDNLIFLIEMFNDFKSKGYRKVLSHVEQRIKQFDLSLTNTVGYIELRREYNKNKKPLDLFVLTAYSFNHQIRFNNSHEFNNPFGKNRSCFNERMKYNLKNFIDEVENKDIIFSNSSFEEFDTSFLKGEDFVYCDPPYLITTGTYNDGKRGFKGWGEKEELILLEKLDELDKKNIKFGLSNVIEHKGKENVLLKKWLNKNPNYKINYLNFDYSNSNYQTFIKDKKSSIEVFITNYKPDDYVQIKLPA
uniref:Dam family site-specific DNA-(adenine-N6)-methyltransferase n=1 Tax=Candidatus Thiodubiliella endoseptemdiera TaxID=2738886 RepID=UPI0034DFCB6E